MKPLTPVALILRLSFCAGILVILMAVSPGVGTESRSFGWRTAVRAIIGLSVEPMTPHAVRHADLDRNGSVSIAEQEAYAATARTLAERRVGRSLLAACVGLTLALCGAVFQVLFRNPLSEPYTLGISSGGSLGALLAIQLGWTATVYGVSSLSVAAFIGCLAVMGLVLVLSARSQRLTSNELLLAGVTLGLFCQAMMTFVTSISEQHRTLMMIRWMMGSLEEPLTGARAISILPAVMPAWLGLVLMTPALNQYRLGDELAAGRGVRVGATRAGSILLCSLATAGVVAYCGPIGFVGLVVPHAVTLIFGPDCRVVLPASGLVGGAFLIICDWLSQVALGWVGSLLGLQLSGATLPIGVVTALVGVPVFLVLLRWLR